MAKGTNFSVWPFRFYFTAVDAVYFPEDKAANVLRGAFGVIFRKLACVSTCPGAAQCEIAHECPYARIFEPKQNLSLQSGPSGLSDWPRPFVFRALHLDGHRIQPGESFYFDLILFEPPEKALPYFVLAFRELGNSGLGPGRGRATLLRVQDLASGIVLYDQHRFTSASPQGIHLEFSEGTPMLRPVNALSRFSFDSPSPSPLKTPDASEPGPKGAVSGQWFTGAVYAAQALSPTRITVRFETPTELKSAGTISETLEFSTLLARLRDRISNLRLCYQGGSLDVDFDAIGRAAAQVRILHSTLGHVNVSRRSSRTGQTHSIGGVTGEIVYQGELTPFVPFLEAGRWTGVGRQSVWGKGELNFSLAGAACKA